MVGPRITVLMPVYNAERYLREAINSILAQSFKPFEFLIIDDGSTDRSAEIIASYRDPRIRYVRNCRNLGITPTLNKGISLASCELIARMDADDISHPQRLQKQFGYMKRNPQCALLSTWARVISEDKKFIRLECYGSNFYYFNLTFECWIYHPTIMFRKSAAEQVGMYSMPYSEDYDLFWRMSTYFPIANLPEPLLDYRLTSASVKNVLRKTEHEIANEQNVLRNIRYYLGNDFEISPPALACLRHNFRPLLARYKRQTVFEALSVLDAVTQKILQKENVNRHVKSVRQARHFKRKFILNQLANALPVIQSSELLLRTGAYTMLIILLKELLMNRIQQWIKSLPSYGGAARVKTLTPQ